MEAFRDQFTATECLWQKEVLYEEATESGMHNVIQRKWMVKTETVYVYRERFFTHVLLQSPTRSEAADLESYLLHVSYTSQLDNLYDDREIDQLELDWITWQRDYAQNKMWGDSRTSILEAMQCKL